ncbi:MAG: Ig-like domain-containing protein [Gemmatimonadaceae bacterium]|nr:Ig-like domain-containing protein [Gemmatimonadaceae bacterium]
MRHTTFTRGLLVAASFLAIVGACSSPSEPAEPAAITLSTTTVALDALGATQQVTATVLDDENRQIDGEEVTWSSSATSVVTVSPAGLITAVTNGPATVTATAGGATAQVAVTVEQLPVAPEVVQGNNQTATVGTQVATPVRVRVVDRLGGALAGRQVTFAVASGGGSVGTPTATSGVDGTAQTTWTLGPLTSTLQRVLVSVQGTLSTSTIAATATAGPAANMLAAPGFSGQGQSANAGSAVAQRPSVKVQDAGGNGIAGVTVSFAVQSGGGSVTGASVVSDANGIATVGSWTLGGTFGANSVRATATGLPPVDFTANAVADVCAKEAAAPIAVGQTINGTLSLNDCVRPAPDLRNFDLYKLTLGASTQLVIDLDATGFDAYLYIFNFVNDTLIAEHDDIVLGTNTDSRINITLPAGEYLIRATSFDSLQTGTYALSVAQSTTGGAASVALNGGNGQVAAPGAAVSINPSVIVRDGSGNPVQGVTVTFAGVPGVGAITGATAVSNASGIATLGSWTLAAGSNVLEATAAGVPGTGVVFNAKGKASSAGFDINLRFVALPTVSQLSTFNAAVTRWETIITSDLTNIPFTVGAGTCNSPVPINETIDDLMIVVRLEPIDGAGSVLGSAGPCFSRTGAQPLLGTMRFDTADLANLEAGGNFGNVILHEMGHVLGIGTLWQSRGLLLNPSLPSSPGADTHFTGAQALIGFNNIGGSTWTGGSKTPVENTQGGQGTRDSHWREGVLANELMTGFLNGGANPLSQLTVRSLVDLGYTVDLNQADAFNVTLFLRAAGSPEPTGIEMKDDVLGIPVVEVDAQGRYAGQPAAVQVKKPRPKLKH